MKTLALVLLGFLAARGQARAEPVPADAETVKFVQYFVKTPVQELQADWIDNFLAIDPGTLPKKLRRSYEARKLELYTLKQVSDSKKKGLLVKTGDDCSIPKDAKSADVALLRMAGYQEIFEDEEKFVIEKTQCSQKQQMCEFTLQVVLEKQPGTKLVRKRYFLHGRDPLMALVAEHRASGEHRNTNFFGLGAFPSCTH